MREEACTSYIIWLHVKWAVRMVIADCHFNLPRGFVWVCMG